MQDQKLDNLLNLALDTPQEEREKSENLDTGYDSATRRWQVIVQHSGGLFPMQETANGMWEIVELSGGYAIVTLPEEDIPRLASLPQVSYIEKPRSLYFSVDQGRAASCLSSVQNTEGGSPGLTGRGILVAVIDSGVDYFHPDFRNADGTTRILALWDQSAGTAAGEPEQESREPVGGVPEQESGELVGGIPEQRGMAAPAGFLQGREYTKEEIDAALAAGSREEAYRIVPVQDAGGHGTEVLGVAAGNGRASGGQYRGVATESDLLVVKLGLPQPDGFPRTTELMQAVEYVIRKAELLRRPVAVNMSFGSASGSRRGTSLLETYLDLMANRWQSVFVVGVGNEGSADGHTSGVLSGEERQTVEFSVGFSEPSLSIQLWKNYADAYRVTLIHPTGQMAGPFGQEAGTSEYRLGSTRLFVYYGEPSPYQLQQEISMEFIPQERYIDSGVWRVILTPERIVNGEYALWMNDSRTRGTATRFLRPNPNATITIPSTAARVTAVGAYDSARDAYAPFSGRGWPDETFGIRPDLVAPGVMITTTAVNGGYVQVSGTSFAAPFVTGAAALLMEWGIIRGNDSYLYGEKVRAFLRRGARPLPAFSRYPNNQVGYGALCVRDSLPN